MLSRRQVSCRVRGCSFAVHTLEVGRASRRIGQRLLHATFDPNTAKYIGGGHLDQVEERLSRIVYAAQLAILWSRYIRLGSRIRT